jgi:hypothetical protein
MNGKMKIEPYPFVLSPSKDSERVFQHLMLTLGQSLPGNAGLYIRS